VRAIVLVGGEGTRLRPLTHTTPKPLLPVGNVPMIERVLAPFAAWGGLDGVVLSLGYKPDAFQAHFTDDRIGGLPVTYAVEPERMDTGGAIGFAAREAGVEGTFLVINGDVLTEIDLDRLVGVHRDRGAEATISLHPVDDPSRFGVVETTPDHRVVRFVEKPPPGEEPTNLISAGTYVMEQSVLDRIPTGRPVSVERETFPALVADGTLYAVACHGYWLDTGTPEQYLEANFDVMDGPVLAAEGATVAESARVHHTVLGAAASVGAGAVVEWSVLLPGARVEAEATISHSVVGADAVVGAGASLTGHCVVADRAKVDAGASLVGEKVEA
jgi:mannose-1-phosphate guanylyltransferase